LQSATTCTSDVPTPRECLVKSTTHFPMMNIVRCPLSPPPRPAEGSETQNNRFLSKNCTLLQESLLQSFFVYWPIYPCKNGLRWRPLLCENWAETDPPPSETLISNQYSLVAHQP